MPQFKSVSIPNSVTSIGASAFADSKNLTFINIPNSAISIGNIAFWGSGLTSVSIPNSVTSIGGHAFYACSSLTLLSIPNSVTSIGDRAFVDCCSLTSISCKAIIPPILGTSVFNNVPKNIPVYVPCNAYSNYRNINWGGFTNFISMPDSTFYHIEKCENASYTDQNFTTPIYSAGTYYRTFSLGGGCDSVVCLTLSDYPAVPVTNYEGSICPDGSYTDAHFTNLNLAGTYYDTLLNRNGCDSVICLTLSISNVTLTNYWRNICQGSSYTDSHFTNLTVAGTYYDTLQNMNGCDSVVCLTLSYYSDVPISNYSKTICQGVPYTDSHFTNLTVAGTYYDTLFSVNGCDSVVCLTLTVIDVSVPTNINITQTENNFSITWQGNSASYELYRNDALLKMLSTTTYTDNDLEIGEEYCYKIKAIEGNCESDFSEDACETFNDEVGIAENQDILSLQIFPNPTEDEIFIQSNLQIEKVEVYSLLGSLLISEDNFNNKISVSALHAGIYLLKVYTNKGFVVRKIVKE